MLFRSDGAMSLEIETELAQALPSLPRIGLLLHLAEVPVRAEWLGRGPHENYPDRLLGADLGHWSLPLEAMHTPYIFPSDNGLRCDTRQLQLGSTTVNGSFHFSASRFSQQQLAAARHQSDLVAEEGLDPSTTLMIGDRKHDLIGARSNGMDAAAVGYGFGSREELSAEAPTYHFETLDDMHQAFLRR